MCIEMASKRIDMTVEEFKDVQQIVLDTGLNYQKDDSGIWIQLPQVATQGERDLHIKRSKRITAVLIQQRQIWQKEARENLKRFR